MTKGEAQYLISDVKNLNKLSKSDSTFLSASFTISIDEEGIWIDENNTRDFKIASYLEENWFKATNQSQKYGDITKVILKSVLDNWPSREQLIEKGFVQTTAVVSEIALKDLKTQIDNANEILRIG